MMAKSHAFIKNIIIRVTTSMTGQPPKSFHDRIPKQHTQAYNLYFVHLMYIKSKIFNSKKISNLNHQLCTLKITQMNRILNISYITYLFLNFHHNKRLQVGLKLFLKRNKGRDSMGLSSLLWSSGFQIKGWWMCFAILCTFANFSISYPLKLLTLKTLIFKNCLGL